MADNTAGNARQERLSTLASASSAELIELWDRAGIDSACEMVRGPEIGLVALRGRIGGGGALFNFGEATVTRATVRLENGAVGHSVALGRDRRKAKLIAILDALAQDPDMESKIDAEIVGPLKESLVVRDKKRRAETAATKVDFFTMVRGED
ncbi:phosphonate C-P lyase system protein PhnG [Oricola cellulosilytica]|uniref:Phosphonate C-P lyase system protein PhnG n=1 Tax=Oricola cellulosilytica TaxID=1429082 RepID=A0A4R0PDQ0_9HYPH|nr:phosphonate C-P lyase system protein PhnG [Oricola cellulosilytica]TCD13366.1 phosphonate C-P lyase system protein PhnG [Oricola cellulosilytica]